jgi:hypothetical protein
MKHIIFLSSILVSAVVSAVAEDDPQDFLPPVLPWQGASQSLVVAPDHPWITPAERTGLTDTPSYDETLDWLRRLCDATPLVSMVEFGRTSQARPLVLVIATRDEQHSAEAFRAGGKPTLLVQAGNHAGEIDGKDAGLMLLRDIAFGGKSRLLDGANLLFIPALNADGHERVSAWNRPNQRGPRRMGWRTTAQNLNLNRDYVKADSPEMRALLAVLNTWPVWLYLDIHATDGVDYQYDVTYTYQGRGGSPAWSPHIGAWLDRSFSPAVDAALQAQGHIPFNLYILPRDEHDLTRGLSAGNAAPRFSHGYGDLRHLPTVLVENHSLKPYPQRVLGTYVLLQATLEHLARDAAALRAAIQADRTARPAEVTLTWARDGATSQIDLLGVDFEIYRSIASGADEIRWLGRPRLFPKLPIYTDKPGLTVKRPAAYWVPASKNEIIDRLQVQGIHVQPLSEARTLDVDMIRIQDVQDAGAGRPYEARHPVRFGGVRVERRRETFPPGSVRVPTDQPLGNLAIMMLHPQGVDSLFAWGFCNEILQRTEYIEGYVIAPLAEKMLADDPALRAEFEAKLADDPEFAADPTARLQWFYVRTKFADERFLLYPVGIESSVVRGTSKSGKNATN